MKTLFLPAYWFKDMLFESFQKSLHLSADGRVCSDVVDAAEVISCYSLRCKQSELTF